VNRVLSDRDAVTVVELLLLDRLAVDQRPVGAPQVDDPELLATPLDPGVMAARGRIAQDQVVIGRAPKAERAVAGAMRVAGVRT
jgi:hypothetical protein